MWAASYGHAEVLKLLLHADASTNGVNRVSLSVCLSVCVFVALTLSLSLFFSLFVALPGQLSLPSLRSRSGLSVWLWLRRALSPVSGGK